MKTPPGWTMKYERDGSSVWGDRKTVYRHPAGFEIRNFDSRWIVWRDGKVLSRFTSSRNALKYAEGLLTQ